MIVRIVTVEGRREIARVEVADDGNVRYSDDTVRAVVNTFRRDRDLSEADAIAALRREGWSNGYLMVALEE